MHIGNVKRLIHRTPSLHTALKNASSLVQVCKDAIAYGKNFGNDEIGNIYGPAILATLLRLNDDSDSRAKTQSTILAIIYTTVTSTDSSENLIELFDGSENFFNPGNLLNSLGAIYLLACHKFIASRIQAISYENSRQTTTLRDTMITNGIVDLFSIFGFQFEDVEINNISEAITSIMRNERENNSVYVHEHNALFDVYKRIPVEQAYLTLQRLRQDFLAVIK